jgi:hypothetical protein
MTAERFMALAAAYGADLRRWPSAERAAAEAYLAASPETARPALAQADEIDALLFASARPLPSAALRDRVLASAGQARLKAAGAGRRWLERMILILGAGWAAAACAGVAAGVLMTTHLTADAQADAVLYQASLSGVDDTEVLG